MVVEAAMILGSPATDAGKRSLPGSGAVFRVILAELCGASGYHWSGRGQAENLAAALDEAGLVKYYSRLPQKCGRFNEIELFDNREWNQNVRGELVVARGLQGP